MDTAKKIRLSRILNPDSKRGIIVPIDHGLTLGPIKGLESTRRMAPWIKSDGINAIIAHKGMVVRLAERDLLGGRGVILHLNGMNAMAGQPDNKEMLTNLKTAARLGVDAVSLQINFTGENDAFNWKLLGQVADEAAQLGFPVLTMLYDKTSNLESKVKINRFRQLLRVAVELGTDAIKIAMPPSLAVLAEILDPVKDDAMIFLAGGEASDNERLLQQVDQAMGLGVSGVCMGRNVFANSDPSGFLKELSQVVHGGYRPLRREAIHA
jgi:fructose-bisphosphate aldolase, class I